MGEIRLHRGKEKRVYSGHPWVFLSDIRSSAHASPGDVVSVLSDRGTFLGKAVYNPASQIALRFLTWKELPAAPWISSLSKSGFCVVLSYLPQAKVNFALG